MTPDSSIDLTLLGRYLDGAASSDERAAVAAWIGDDSARRDAFRSLQSAWNTDARRMGAAYDVEAGLAELTARLAPHPARRFGVPAAPGWRHLRWAAAILVLAGAGAAWWKARTPPPPTVVQAMPMQEYATPRGRRAVFHLLDGTEITLNADSRLRVPVAYGAAGRDVYLEGEAFFSVVHDDAHPFVVHVAGGTIRDVGTQFSVRAYADDGAERVAVSEGVVAVAAGKAAGADEVMLRANDVAARSADGRVTPLRGANVTDELAWTDGRLVLDDIPLGEAARRLGRWYDLEIVVPDAELARQPVSGVYEDEPVREVLTLVTAAIGARAEWHGRRVTISRSDRAP